MDTNKMREQFEKFALSSEGGLFPGHLAKGEDGEYLNYAAQCYWLFWQASREAVVVELTAEYELPPTMDLQSLVTAIRKQDIATIEAQGLKVKP